MPGWGGGSGSEVTVGAVVGKLGGGAGGGVSAGPLGALGAMGAGAVPPGGMTLDEGTGGDVVASGGDVARGGGHVGSR
jgi:hypothetical protein